MSGLSRSFIPDRSAAKHSTVAPVPVQCSFQVSAVADSPRSPSLVARLKSLRSATADLASSGIVFRSISL